MTAASEILSMAVHMRLQGHQKMAPLDANPATSRPPPSHSRMSMVRRCASAMEFTQGKPVVKAEYRFCLIREGAACWRAVNFSYFAFDRSFQVTSTHSTPTTAEATGTSVGTAGNDIPGHHRG
ncbi:hypothetical protein CSUB01_01369 [Colletotrichum sublineola]|uniref:Uncharacterized protein n=1 Tax=Colletotrichum sublineola TaxID=1173701 RepID=A0A066XEV1_COLSU|nr:hypothetical protein CSUB01_01369 [Colletotrichum sublineola]